MFAKRLTVVLFMSALLVHAEINITRVAPGTPQPAFATGRAVSEHPWVLNLHKAQQRYRTIKRIGGWPTDPEVYRDGDRVRLRLALTGDFSYDAEGDREASEAFTEAVRAFQRRHHLRVDGIVGPKTREKLAEGVDAKLDRIRINLERWRKFGPVDPGEYVMVNIADFTLELKTGDRRLAMKAVMGREGRKTPIMKARMESVVLNPFWRVPETILTEDILPELRADSGYLSKQGMTLFHVWDRKEQRPIDPQSIDWLKFSPESLEHYVFRQEPGPHNPLGAVKFVFPNPDDIYIHDSPRQDHFKKRSRLASSGCIRIEKPMELAQGVLARERPGLTYKQLFDMLRTDENRVIYLQKPIPVYITYQTAWADDDGRLYLRDDVYGYDSKK